MKNAPKKEMTALIVNIKYSNIKFGSKEGDCPDTMEVNIPEKVLEQESSPNFLDIIETFCYNLVSTINGRCVTYCQIWLNDEPTNN